MATDDVLARARAVVARLREAEGQATPGPWAQGGPTSPDWWPNGPGDKSIVRGYDADMDEDDAAAIVALRNAAPALIRLAEAVTRLDSIEVGFGWKWYEDTDVGGTFCRVCEAVIGAGEDHHPDCPAVAIDAALAALADDTTGGDTMTNEPPPFTGLALDAPVTARDIAAEIGVYCDSAGENYTLRAVNPDGSPGDVLAFVPGGAAVAFALAEPYNAAQADAGGEVGK